MKVSDQFTLFSQMINFVIFIYFILSLAKINALDATGILVSAFGLMVSLLSSILSAVEERKEE
jgi:hypothetical protein